MRRWFVDLLHIAKDGSSQRTCAGIEAQRVIAVLRVLPELHIGVIEDIGIDVHVVEALRREHHAHIIASVEQWQRLKEEVRIGDLHIH